MHKRDCKHTGKCVKLLELGDVLLILCNVILVTSQQFLLVSKKDWFKKSPILDLQNAMKMTILV